MSSSGTPPPTAQLLGWMVMAAVNACFVAQLGGFSFVHHAYDAGQMVTVGLVSAGIAGLWRGLGRERGASLALFVLGAVVAWWQLWPSLSGFAERVGGGHGEAALRVAVAIGGGAFIPCAASFGKRLRGLVGVPLAVGVAVANNLVLPQDYRGVHLMLAWGGALLAAGGLARQSIRVPLPALGLLAVLGVWSVVDWPSMQVLGRIYRVDGAVVMPLIADLRRLGKEAPRTKTRRHPPPPDRPASAPSLLGGSPIIVFLTIDSLRADVLTRPEHAAYMPNLVSLCASSVVFTNARSPGAGTRLTLAQIFSGLYYSQLHWTQPFANRPRLDREPTPRFPELLRKHGYDTVTFAAHRFLLNEHGIVRGFTEETAIEPGPGRDDALADRTLPAVDARILAQGDLPLFVFAHFMDAHAPYDAAGTEGSTRQRYLRELGLVDDELGRMRERLVARWDRIVLIVTSDHGEAFGQHGVRYHNRSLYDELLRVPLCIRVPGVEHRLVDEPVTLMDLGPTVLDLALVPTPGHFMGASLVPFLRGESPSPQRPIVAERRFAQAMVFGDGFKVIADQERHLIEVYDLTHDPTEEHNLYDPARDQSGVMRLAELERFMAQNGFRPVAPEAATPARASSKDAASSPAASP